MKNYTANSFTLSLLKQCTFFNEESGLISLPSSHVIETRVGNKYIYKLVGSESELINKLHENLNETLFCRIPVNQAATAYTKNKSYLDFLEPHRNNFYFLRVDLKNFFHFINREIIKDSLKDHVSSKPIISGCRQSNLDFIVNVLTIKLPETSKNTDFIGKSILPIGFKSSPVVSNIIFRKLDILIERFCFEHNIIYTRYADDMLFSSSDLRNDKYQEKSVFDDLFKKKEKNNFLHSDRFLEQISFIVNIDGFRINSKKTVRSKKHLGLNGYLISGSNYPYIDGKIRISNKKTKKISKLIYECNTDKSDLDIFKVVFSIDPFRIKFRRKPKVEFLNNYCCAQINNKIIGYRSYLISLLKYNDKYSCLEDDFIFKVKGLIKESEKIINNRMKKEI
ncbi:reverse transcriptase family protein [Photobacterium angustum]|uniref:Reverse transcriptase domain-containing protein n=1 Tax=Photobacterium angustum TaxID=661 RepID=A0A2S7VXM5_PHOAN|nr:reverse transcriptase family protein [Photobacterium angustum]PQJ66862.1 hypothetical protein BTO08_05210 [Photobacterium angustum]